MTNRRTASSLLIALLFIPTSACWTMTHTVGQGGIPTRGVPETARQWFILWGLVPLNHVDSKNLARGAKDYTVTTQESFVDVVIGLITGLATIHSRTVTVTR